MRMPSYLKLLLAFLCFPSQSMTAQDNPATDSKQLYEIRHFAIDGSAAGSDAQAAAVDEFLSQSFLPALKRAGAGHVGIFAPAPGAQTADRFAVITYESADQVAAVADKLRSDEAYLAARQALEQGGPKNPPYGRVSSELLLAMDCMPQAKAPSSVGTAATRVYELRVYESANEGLGDRKVEMFNEGEVPIFLDCGIEPVFLGQALVGRYAPSLTYLTAYPNDAERQESWNKFRQHPDWKTLSGMAKYQGTVSKIHLFLLKPLEGSEL